MGRPTILWLPSTLDIVDKELSLMFLIPLKSMGKPHLGLFRPSRGLRQGDPLSPYLFIICMEVLIRKLSMHSHTRSSGIGFKVHPRSTNISCLMFANDSLLFCKDSTEACRTLKSTLNDFCNLSGQLVNFHKSSIVFSKNVPSYKETKSRSTIQYASQNLSGTLSRCFFHLLLPNQNRSRFHHY